MLRCLELCFKFEKKMGFAQMALGSKMTVCQTVMVEWLTIVRVKEMVIEVLALIGKEVLNLNFLV